MNQTIIQGRLVSEPILTTETANNKKINMVNFTIKETITGNTNRRGEIVQCIAWDSGANAIAKYFHRGDSVLIRGRLQTSKVENENGGSIQTTKLRVEEFQKLYLRQRKPKPATSE